MIASYVPSLPAVASLGGTTQLLPNGHTLIAFGNGGHVEEYDAAGRMVWRIEGDAGGTSSGPSASARCTRSLGGIGAAGGGLLGALVGTAIPRWQRRFP